MKHSSVSEYRMNSSKLDHSKLYESFLTAGRIHFEQSLHILMIKVCLTLWDNNVSWILCFSALCSFILSLYPKLNLPLHNDLNTLRHHGWIPLPLQYTVGAVKMIMTSNFNIYILDSNTYEQSLSTIIFNTL